MWKRISCKCACESALQCFARRKCSEGGLQSRPPGGGRVIHCCAPWSPHLLLTVCSAAAESLQSCPTLCNPTDGSPPGSSVPGILQARKLEWVAISSSRYEYGDIQSIAEWLTYVLLWSWSFSWTLYLLSTFLLHIDTLSSLTITSWVHLIKLFIFFLIKDCEENTTLTHYYFSFTLKKNYLFIWLCQVLVIACRIFSSGIWDLVPWPGIEHRTPCTGHVES